MGLELKLYGLSWDEIINLLSFNLDLIPVIISFIIVIVYGWLLWSLIKG